MLHVSPLYASRQYNQTINPQDNINLKLNKLLYRDEDDIIDRINDLVISEEFNIINNTLSFEGYRRTDEDFPHRLTYNNLNLLQLACLHVSSKVVKYSIEKGLDVNQTDINGNIPLVYATFPQGSEKAIIIKSLIDAGCNIDKPNIHDKTPLQFLNDYFQNEDNIPLDRLKVAQALLEKNVLSKDLLIKVHNLAQSCMEDISVRNNEGLLILLKESAQRLDKVLKEYLIEQVNKDSNAEALELGSSYIDLSKFDSSLLEEIDVPELITQIISGEVSSILNELP